MCTLRKFAVLLYMSEDDCITVYSDAIYQVECVLTHIGGILEMDSVVGILWVMNVLTGTSYHFRCVVGSGGWRDILDRIKSNISHMLEGGIIRGGGLKYTFF